MVGDPSSPTGMAPHEHLVTVSSLLAQQGHQSSRMLAQKGLRTVGCLLGLFQDHCRVTLPVSLPIVLSVA